MKLKLKKFLETYSSLPPDLVKSYEAVNGELRIETSDLELRENPILPFIKSIVVVSSSNLHQFCWYCSILKTIPEIKKNLDLNVSFEVLQAVAHDLTLRQAREVEDWERRINFFVWDCKPALKEARQKFNKSYATLFAFGLITEKKGAYFKRSYEVTAS